MEDLLSISEIRSRIGQKIRVAGWVHDVRLLGGINFVLLRNREGIIQLTTPKKSVTQEILDAVSSLHPEDVILCTGLVKDSKIARNGFEIIPDSITVLIRVGNTAPTRSPWYNGRQSRHEVRVADAGPEETGDDRPLQGGGRPDLRDGVLSPPGRLHPGLHPQHPGGNLGGWLRGIQDRLLRQARVPAPGPTAPQAARHGRRAGQGLRPRRELAGRAFAHPAAHERAQDDRCPRCRSSPTSGTPCASRKG